MVFDKPFRTISTKRLHGHFSRIFWKMLANWAFRVLLRRKTRLRVLGSYSYDSERKDTGAMKGRLISINQPIINWITNHIIPLSREPLEAPPLTRGSHQMGEEVVRKKVFPRAGFPLALHPKYISCFILIHRKTRFF